MKAILKKNKFAYFLIIQAAEALYRIKNQMKEFIIPSIRFNANRFLRQSRMKRDTPYERLKELKDKHKGERCFIIATGPSLTIEDLEKLKHEVTISMNSICLAFDETDWRPTYYGIQDENVYERMRPYIEEMDVEGMFVSDTIPRALDMELPKDCYLFPLNMLNHNACHKRYHSKFSKNPFLAVYSGYTITYSLLQIAIFMGFKEIYLLGADCHYASDMKHHFKDYGHIDRSFATAGEKMMSAYKVAKQHAKKHQINIFNATRGGMLEVFERVDLDAVVSGPQKKGEGFLH